MGFIEWTIFRNANGSDIAYSVSENGNMNSGLVGESARGVRPTFSLASSVTYASGDGTQSNPIRIN